MIDGSAVAVVTGASRGIGEAVARRLRAGGYRTVGLARSPGEDIVPCDVGDEREVVDAFDVIGQAFGPVSLVVNAAGMTEVDLVHDWEPESFVNQWRTNLLGTALVCREFVRRLPDDVTGRIVNVSSTSASRPAPGWGAYSSSKAAVEQLTRTLSEELDSVHVFGVAPGRCATDLRRVLAPDEDPASIMQPDEVADVVFWLLTDRSAPLLSGQMLRVRRDW
jgi:3-oxoacyl-[acyl-carrier protein] reductase